MDYEAPTISTYIFLISSYKGDLSANAAAGWAAGRLRASRYLQTGCAAVAPGPGTGAGPPALHRHTRRFPLVCGSVYRAAVPAVLITLEVDAARALTTCEVSSLAFEP